MNELVGKPCENPGCALFFIDHSKPNKARWCSMAACGNRMKARRHYARARAKEQHSVGHLTLAAPVATTAAAAQ